MNPEPYFFKGVLPVENRRSVHDRRPVEGVSWFDIQEFCRRLSQRTGRTYTLPSESQWEYACRAGTTTPYAFGTTLSQWQANVNSSGTTEVGSFPANAWGLHDMHGNVYEWCMDQWHPGYEGAPADGSAWLSTTEQQDQSTTKAVNNGSDDLEEKLLRGGSWDALPGDCRSACRYPFQPDDAYFDVGFRVACLPQGPSLNPLIPQSLNIRLFHNSGCWFAAIGYWLFRDGALGAGNFLASPPASAIHPSQLTAELPCFEACLDLIRRQCPIFLNPPNLNSPIPQGPHAHPAPHAQPYSGPVHTGVCGQPRGGA
jgi:hypothetical protein